MAPQGGFPLRCPTAKFLQRSIRETIVAREPYEAVIWGLQEMPPTLGRHFLPPKCGEASGSQVLGGLQEDENALKKGKASKTN